MRRNRFRLALLAQSRHELMHRTCLLLTQGGHSVLEDCCHAKWQSPPFRRS